MKKLKIEAVTFLDQLFIDLEKANINVDTFLLDHICYRAKDEESYIQIRDFFKSIGTLLGEPIVMGRTYCYSKVV